MKKGIFNKLINRKASLAVIGSSTRTMELAHSFSKQFNTINYQLIDENATSNATGRLKQETNNVEECKREGLAKAKFYVIAAKIDMNEYYKPKLKELTDAVHLVARNLKKGDYVVFESTSFPGCIEEVCIPILEKSSNLKVNEEFKVGFSPEKFNYDGDDTNKGNSSKLVSGSDENALEEIFNIYKHVLTSNIHKVANIRLTEIMKIIHSNHSHLSEKNLRYA